jgi:hypothetical protein
MVWGEGCSKCDGVNGALVFAFLVLSFAVVVFLFKSGGSSAGAVSVFLYFVQTAQLEIGSDSRYLEWLHVFNLGANSVSSCLAPWTPYEQVLFSLLLPLFLLGELLFLAFLHFALHRYFLWDGVSGFEGTTLWKRLGLHLAQRCQEFSWNRYVGGGVCILMFCYTPVTKTAMQYLYCVHVGSELRLFVFPSVDCRSSTYLSYLVPVLLVIFFYVLAFPAVTLLWLWRRKWTPEELEAGPDGTPSIFAQRWGPLHSLFDFKRAWFWSPMLLVRRACFVLAAVLLIQQPSVRYMTFGLLHFAFLQLHIVVRPFSSVSNNRADTVSYGLLVCFSLLLTGYAPPYPTFVQVLTFMLIAPAAAIFAIRVVWSKWGAISQKIMRKVVTANKGAFEEFVEPDSKARPNDALDVNPLRLESIELSDASTFSTSSSSPTTPSIRMLHVPHAESKNDLAPGTEAVMS